MTDATEFSRGHQSSTPWECVRSGKWPRSLWLSPVVCKTAVPRIVDLPNRVGPGHVCTGVRARRCIAPAIARGIMVHMRAEKEIRQVNAELEQRVQERTAQLEAANRALETFSSAVAHDLRAPWRSLDGFSQALLEDCAEVLDAQGRDYLERIRSATQHLGQLIEDLFAFAGLSQAPLRTQPVAPGDLAREALAELRPAYKGRQVDIAIADLPCCQADPAQLRRVWVCLLSNALKFTRTRAVARIEVGVQAVEGTPVYFVRDNGVGFDMQDAGELFSVFQRLHPLTEYEGAGVGLALTQRIVHRHGGRIWAEATVNQGATFYFTLGA
jgi:light-regulated signal transduction histidine kinase (bacteriophytochrome)